MLKAMNLNGKTALVTGSGRRIGRSIALALAKEGCNLALHYHNSQKETEELAALIRRMGPQAQVYPRDLTETERLGPWFDTITGKSGEIHILVNSASAYTEDSYATLSPRALSRSMALHLLGPLTLIQAMFRQENRSDIPTPESHTAESRAVVNILDTRISTPDAHHASYHLGKTALATVSRELALEMAPAMRINSVAPGIILPPEGEGKEWLENMKHTNPLGRRGYPEDVAAAVVFLCRSGFITGQTLFVDGGRHLKGSCNAKNPSP